MPVAVIKKNSFRLACNIVRESAPKTRHYSYLNENYHSLIWNFLENRKHRNTLHIPIGHAFST